VTLFFPASQGADTTQVYYVGFLGTWSEVCCAAFVALARTDHRGFQRKSDPVITVYEAQANLADHEKIQGTEGNLSYPGL